MRSYYGGKQLADSFRTVRKNTIQVAEDIPEDKYGFVAAPDARSVGQMLTHIAISTHIADEIHKKGTNRLSSASTSSDLWIVSRLRKPSPDRKPKS